MTVTHLIYTAAGSPEMDGGTSGTCRPCGADATGLPFGEWVRDTFTDWDKLLPGDIICQACQFCFCESSEQLARRVGKDKPQRMRNYSHFVVSGQWLPLSKGDKARMRDILLSQSPDVAAIAVSGQKHIIFRARPGWWQIEEQAVRPFSDKLRIMLALVEELYNGGISKSEIESGRYEQHRIIAFGFEKWLEIERQIKLMRGSMSLQLAAFLAQKETETDGQLRDGEIAPGPDLARDSGGLQAPICPQCVATVRGQREGGSLHEQPEQILQYDLL